MTKKIQKQADAAPQQKAADSPAPHQNGNGHGITFPSAVLNAFYYVGFILLAFAGIFISLGYHIVTACLASGGGALVISGLIFNFVAARRAKPQELHVFQSDEIEPANAPDEDGAHNHTPQTLTWQFVLVFFTILMVIIFGIPMILNFLFKPNLDKVYQDGFEKGKADYIAAHTPPTPTNATQVLPDGRILFTDVTPEYLGYLFDQHTDAEALKLIEPYKNKWIIFDGRVHNLQNLRSFSALSVDRPEPFGAHSAYFTDAKQIERLQPLTRGNPVKVLCEIVANTDLSLDNCELLDN